METFSIAIVFILACWATLRLVGFFGFVEKIWCYVEAKRATKKLARYLIHDGSDLELRTFLMENRFMLSNESIDGILQRLTDLKDEKIAKTKEAQEQLRGSMN